MEISGQALRLRIYASSTDKIGHDLLSEYLVSLANRSKMAGATVVKGMIGYGSSSVIHSYKLWELTEKLPVVIEIIDEESKVRAFYEEIKEVLENMRYGCLVTMEKTEVMLYKSGKSRSI